jgi:hypothetical protein
MKITTILLVFSLILLASPTGLRIAAEIAILILGTGLALQAIIYSIRRFRTLRPLRMLLVGGFDRLPDALGFGLLVLLGASVISLLVFVLRDRVSPSDSWVPITLGLLWGIMGPVFRSLKAGESNREQGVAPQPAARSESDFAASLPPST